jgi:hypothetical protein
MELPTVSHVRQDGETKVVYDIRAYRPLTEQEILDSIRWYLSRTPVKKRAKRGQRITIITIIGHNGG